MSVGAGECVEGRYRLVAQIGEGTFGEVWRATDARLSERAVAVKFLKPEFMSNEEAVNRFAAEADALARVQHANVVAVLDRGRWRGRHFLVTEFVEGTPLTAWIERRRAEGLPSIAAALAIFDQVCAGMEAAHAVRIPGPIVHRDLKPDNLLMGIGPDGAPIIKVVDFGIAQLGSRSGTRTGVRMGTLTYMSPEQGLGNAAAVGPWTDVFALGVILVELLTLRAQPDPETTWWATAVQRGDVRSRLFAMRSDVPSGLWDVAALALSEPCITRPRDAGTLRATVRRASDATRTAGNAATVIATPSMPAVETGPLFPPTRTLVTVPPAVSSTAALIRGGLRTAPPARPLVAYAFAAVATVSALTVGAALLLRARSSAEPPSAVAEPTRSGAEPPSAVAEPTRSGAEPPSAVTSPTPPSAPSETAAPESVSVLRPSETRASSYIVLRDHSFPPGLAFDDDPGTAWNEGVRGPGRGEWIEASFDRPVRVRQIELATGWNAVSPRGTDLFHGNARLRRLRVDFSTGRALVRDIGPEERVLRIDGLDERSTTVRFTALDVWPGTRWEDLAISDITLRGTRR